MDFVALDFEKLNDSALSVCEVGLVEYKDGKVLNEFQSYINPVTGLERNRWALSLLSHISDDILIKAPSYDKLFSSLREMIQDKVLVVHSKGADLNYIYNLEKYFHLPKLYSCWLDTREIANHVGSDESLSGLYFSCFNTLFPEHHKALEDARACGKIFDFISSRLDIRHFIHKEEYLPKSEKPEKDNSTTSRHTQFGTATVEPDGLVFNHDKISDRNFFRDKTVTISGMSGSDNVKIKSILEVDWGAKCTSSLSGKTNVFIINQHKVGPSKRVAAIGLQQTTGLLVITDNYFWELYNR